MSNTKQILAMLESRAENDDERFFAIALQVAAAEARRGRRESANALRDAVEEARKMSPARQRVPVSLATPRGDLADILVLRKPRYKLSDVALSNSLSGQLDVLVKEQIKREWLREHGKTPNRRVLFVGPPGSGKTMSAEALASALNLPLYVIRLETLITRFMGETAAKLRLVFDEVSRRRAVFLFDEFDALGAHRAATNDVAEMRRVLNTFLQLMEEPNSTDSVIVGATNFPDLLDGALLRRFDLVLRFEPPTEEQIRQILKANLVPMKHSRLAWKKILKLTHGLSQSEIARAAESAVKTAILDQRSVIKTDDIILAIEARQQMRLNFTSPVAS
jgi:SpoVK/Ycf46/Vps4 family AAA+-type ATPase